MGVFQNIFDPEVRKWNADLSKYIKGCMERLGLSASNEYKSIGNSIIAFAYLYCNTTAAPSEKDRIIKVNISSLKEGSVSDLARLFAGYAVGVLALKASRPDKEFGASFARSYSELMDLRAQDVHLVHDLMEEEDRSLAPWMGKMFGLVCDVLNHNKLDVGARMHFELILQAGTLKLLENAFGGKE